MPHDSLIDQILKSDTLPTLPVVASKLLALSAEEEADLQQIAAVVAQDVSLSSKILRVVNSPFYGFASSIGTISKAVSVMGINPVRSLVLSFSLLEVKNRAAAPGFSFEKFWECSLATAVSARMLMVELEDPAPEEGFIAGLLENVGEMLLALALPERYGEVRRQPFDHGNELAAREQSLLGADHAEIGAEIAQRWRLPAEIVLPLRYHHAPERYAGDNPRIARLAAVAHLAGLLADIFYAAHPEKAQALFLERARHLLALGERAFSHLAPRVHEEVNQAAACFGVQVRLQQSIEEILQEANLRLGQINLTYEQTNRDLEKARAELLRLNQELQAKSQTLERLAQLDGLTGAYNRRFFQSFLHGEISRAARGGHGLSLILADIDDFKALNDSAGHQAGDAVLRALCTLVRELIREYDMLARYGGEEFVVVLPETEAAIALEVAERIRRKVAEHDFVHAGQTHRITLSLGVAFCRPAMDSCGSDDLVRHADLALLEVKKHSKNQVKLFAPPSGEPPTPKPDKG
ncbi:sensor domain-containing diguanylate cyclase [Geoalkalibacter halelectricus]|uniref:sensor domain-containing diguanylate cyclase n=1 Tax=Geoalkalibacter halelectricus TaxID=2847045 RepID=UPI003D223431